MLRTPVTPYTFGYVSPLVVGIVRASALSVTGDIVSDNSSGIVLCLDVGDSDDLGVLVVSDADAGADGSGCSVVPSS